MDKNIFVMIKCDENDADYIELTSQVYNEEDFELLKRFRTDPVESFLEKEIDIILQYVPRSEKFYCHRDMLEQIRKIDIFRREEL